MMSLALGKFQTEGGVAQKPLWVSEKYRECPFVWYENIRSAVFGFVKKHACDRRIQDIIPLDILPPNKMRSLKLSDKVPSFDRMILARTQH